MKRALFVMSTRGMGHVTRSRALAAELTKRGWRCTMSNKSPLSASSHDVSIVDLEGEEWEHDVYAALQDKKVVAIVDTPHAVQADIVVCGTIGVDAFDFPRSGAGWVTEKARTICAGRDYALLRPEFRERRLRLEACVAHMSLRAPVVFDLRAITDLGADQLAGMLFSSVAAGDDVITYGGMRAVEAACVRHGAAGMTIEARNPAEELNRTGLLADGTVDGLGCVRVADAIEARA